ncbi:protein odr-4 homolog isoform X1 [Panicum hallii]|uniref:protein odr-4 homolog isoform X1 n=1 Tax=Panicum hallii TaxID=206008 RepID=UPI000DF4E47D|nr:protein odr-4 homolog isoform X1 [Panicum hallii]
MVKAVVGDEAHLKAFEEALSSSSSPPPQAQVGLVVGKLSASSDRALVYSLLPTPPTEAGAPACSLRAAPKPKASKAKAPSSSDATLEFDVDWIAEHARQVSRMLLGGMSVIGIYIWASEASFKATPPAVLSQVIRAVFQACYGSTLSERLLIHISYSPRRWACRICEVASGSLRPCDFKYSKLLASLQTFRCRYNFQIRLTAVQAEPFKKVILKAISHLTEEVQNARALVDGCLFSEDINISTDGPHQVDFLVPFKNAVPIEGASANAFAVLFDDTFFFSSCHESLTLYACTKECSLEGVAGLLHFAGSVSALAYLGPKESISEAISDLKADIITSLRSRLDIILDEADDGSATNELEQSPSQKVTQVVFHELREPYCFSFPRRVLIPWLGGAYVCDYLQQSETTEDATDRCKEVIPLETAAASSSILEPESAAVCGTLESFWDMVPGARSGGRNSSSRLKDSGCTGQEEDGSRSRQGAGNFNILAAMFALLVALIGGVVFTFSAGSNT